MQRIPHITLLKYLILLGLLLPVAVGCSAPWSKGKDKDSKWYSLDSTWPFGDDEDEPQIPERLMGTWTDTVLYQPGKKPQRGFGGRLIFFGKKSDLPILVEGQLVVYAFDESNREPTDNKPTRRYVFPPDQIARHMSKSELVPTYSFWLPWDEDGGPQIEVSLVARFEPKEGAVVVGEQTKHLLPGKLSPADIAGTPAAKLPEGVPMRPALPQLAQALEPKPTPEALVQQASYEAAAAAATPNRRMTTTSISLPQNFGRRIGTTTPPAAATARQPAPFNAGSTPMSPTSAAPQAPPQPAPPKFTQNAPVAYQRTPLQTAYKPMPESPFAGKAMFGTDPQMPPGAATNWPPTAAQAVGLQVPVSPSESKWTTTVSYSAPVEGEVARPAPAAPAPQR
jgi:hypothetical protein